jgi:hypothetical protein
MIRVGLPYHLRNLAKVGPEVELDVQPPVTIHTVLSTLESRYPMLRGTIRDHGTLKRRAFLRYHTCGMDVSFQDPNAPLPEAVASGSEPLLIVGAVAGG